MEGGKSTCVLRYYGYGVKWYRLEVLGYIQQEKYYLLGAYGCMSTILINNLQGSNYLLALYLYILIFQCDC